jgi:hypothetical protein
MDDKVARLRGVALRAGAILYCAAIMMFGITLILLAAADRYSGAHYVLAIIGEGLVGIGLAVLLLCTGIGLRYAARQVAAD